MNHAIVQVRGERLHLLAEKAIHWPARRALLVADPHVGKAMHFRKAGIAAPAAIEAGNMERLRALVERHRPVEVVFLGDLFHSHHNSAWDGFIAFRNAHPHIHFTLITGNHDILHAADYANAGVQCVDRRMDGPFLLTHHPTMDPLLYNLAGHVHPGVHLLGKGRQHITLPCFHFGRKAGLLPAFGRFTGLHALAFTTGDRAFAIAEEHVLRCSIA